ncbi:xylulokinase [Halovulum sp. GXIMD14793]
MFLGIDLGTSGVKSVLIDEAQTVIGQAQSPLSVSRPQPSWSEQAPADWITAVEASLDSLTSDHPTEMAALSGIGLSGQMHGAVLLDTADRPLRPAILWNDGRSAQECATLEARADFRGIGGNIVMPGFTAPKLEWVRQHEPDTFHQIAKVLLPKDYVRLWLTGGHVSEMSDSAGTLWLDAARRQWSTELLSATGLTDQQMPDLVEGTEASGTLRPKLAKRWGIQRSVTVAGGGGDNAASACGVGAVTPGSGFLSLGSSGVLFVTTAGFAPNTEQAVHSFCHAVPRTWHQMGVILSAADSLNWLSRITGQPPAALTQAAARIDKTPVTFLPYLSGERTPHNNAAATGAFDGLTQSTDIADLARALLEGVAFALADNVAALNTAGTEPGTVFAIGGGSRSDLWLQIISDVTGLSLAVPKAGDVGAAFGAARLAICAATGADPQSVCMAPEAQRQITPNPDHRSYYETRLSRFRALYPALNR